MRTGKDRRLRHMGVDEIFLGKKAKSITVVSNLESGEPVWFGLDRKNAWKSEKRYNLPVLKFWSRPKVVFGGAKVPRAEKKLQHVGSKVANGCTLRRTGEPKMEIPVSIR